MLDVAQSAGCCRYITYSFCLPSSSKFRATIVLAMASSYFTVPSFNRAKKNKEDLEKTNPQEPVLKDEDEKFFDKEMRTGSTSEGSKEVPATKITDDGEEKPLTPEEKEEAIASEDQTVIPDNRPDSGIAQETPDDGIAQGDGASYDDAQKEKAAAAMKERKEKKKNKGMDLPSQEDAEAATRGYHAQAPGSAEGGDKAQGEKKTWASYLPAMRAKRPQSSGTSEQMPPASAGGDEKKEGEAEAEGEKADEKSTDETQPPRTWTQYASSYVPSMPAFKSRGKKPDADGMHEPVYNEDGTINEAATAEKQEREVSVLLDNLNLSSINNRVFSFSAETQRLYERFLLCLKDVINGAPTAYEDMDKLMKEAGPKLEEQWKTMPPFVQTLVKSLPMRLGPEIMAVAAENPNDEMRKNLQNASKGGSSGGAGAGVAAAAMKEGGDAAKEEGGKDGDPKKKRKVPGLKSLVSEQGAIATLLRNTVSFIQTRFPFLASTTNVVMSLAVFSKSLPSKILVTIH